MWLAVACFGAPGCCEPNALQRRDLSNNSRRTGAKAGGWRSTITRSLAAAGTDPGRVAIPAGITDPAGPGFSRQLFGL